MTRLKEEAFGRRVFERALPGREVLAQRLFAQSQELADTRRHLQRYHDLVVTLQQRIEDAAGAAPDPALRELRAFLERGLAAVLATDTADPIAIMDDMLKVVSAHVSVRPSGHEFFVEGRDTLLQAGLKAGLKLGYGCGNGTCGLCKARVVSGEVTKLAPHDYPLSEAERAQGHVLLCVHSAASSEIVLETLEAKGPRDIPEQEIAVRVRGVRPLAADTLHLHLQTPRTTRLRFLAGQSVTLSAAAGGVEAQATYAIASCPCDERNLHFHVRRDAADAFARLLFDGALTTGSTINLAGPLGDFVFWESERPPRVPGLRHGVRTDQEPDRARDGRRRGRVAGARVARHAPRRALPRQPVPGLGRGVRPVPVRGVHRRRSRDRRDPAGRGHGRGPAAGRLRRVRRRTRAVRRRRRRRRWRRSACRPDRSTRRSHERAGRPERDAGVAQHRR